MRVLLTVLALTISCWGFGADKVNADNFPHEPEIVPLGTRIIYEFQNQYRTWRLTEVFEERMPDGSFRTAIYAFLPNGEMAIEPFRFTFRDEKHRILKDVWYPHGDQSTVYEYDPHSCDRTLGHCKYSWTKLTDGEKATGEGEANSFLDGDWLVVERPLGDGEVERVKKESSLFNIYGMRTDYFSVVGGRQILSFRLIELKLPD